MLDEARMGVTVTQDPASDWSNGGPRPKLVEEDGPSAIDAAPVDQRIGPATVMGGYGAPLIENSRRSDEPG